MWRKRECTPPNPSVREALKNHLIDLERRCVALEKIIATEDPERAEEMLVRIEPPTVLEVELRPRTVFETFGTLMDRSFFPKID